METIDRKRNIVKNRSQIDYESRMNASIDALGSRRLPHSIEAEMAVIGAMMMDRGAISKAVEILDIQSFYNEANREIFSAILNMFEKSMTIDIVSLAEELSKKNVLEAIGGPLYLSELFDKTPTAANIETHARIVQERFLKRMLINTAGKILSDAYDDSTDALEEIDKAENALFQISQKRIQKSYVSIKKVAFETIDIIQVLVEKDKKGVTGVSSGFHELDKITGGFQKSDLIIIAARPSMGKTAFALSIARNAAVEYQVPIAFFSVEMAAIQLVIRLLSAEAKINGNNIRTGNINQKDFAKIAQTIGRIADSPIVIDDSPSLTIMELRAKARRLIAEYQIKMIIVDYLQLMRSPKAESREREISIISQSLKQLAKELNIPVIALAQLNRGVESRQDKRPMLSDLRESGSIEQDADVVMFIHRPEQYGIATIGDKSSEGIAEIIVSKQRNGPTGSVQLAYKKDYARFENLQFGFQEPPSDIGLPDDYPDDMISDEDSPF